MSGLLDVEGLSVRLNGLPVLDRVSLSLSPGETLGLVGESGAGKSFLARLLIGLPPRGAVTTAGQIRFDGRALASEPEWRRVRGSGIGLVLQHPGQSFSSLRTIGRQIADVIRAHRLLSRTAAAEAAGLLETVGLAGRADAYPFALSGGMVQRAALARALAAGPRLLIADEPTASLDPETAAAVLDLLSTLARERGMATLLITHDLGLAAARCQRIAVLHAGQVAEVAEAAALLVHPAHPYSDALLRASPQRAATLTDLAAIPSGAPDLARADLPACRFYDRCPRRTDLCRAETPRWEGRVACHHPL